MITLSSAAWDGYVRPALASVSKLHLKIILISCLVSTVFMQSHAQVYQTVADGNWLNNGIWTTMSPGTLVDPAETVYVSHNVITASNLNFQGVVIVDGNLTTAGNISLTGELVVTGQVLANSINLPLGGVIRNNGGSISTTNDITAPGGMIDNCGDMNVGGVLDIDAGTLMNCATGVICATGDIIFQNFSQVMLDGFIGTQGDLRVNSSFVFGCGLWNVGNNMTVTSDSWWDGCARVCVNGGINDGTGNVVEDCPTVAAAGVAPPCGPGIILAIKIDYFEAMPGDRDVALSWKAGNTLEEARYRIERAGQDMEFEEIAEVHSNEMLSDGSFELTDHAPLDGMNHYRLVAIDLDGEESDKLVSVQMDLGELPMNVNIYPNPLSGAVLHLDLGKTFDETTTIRIIDLRGMQVDQFRIPGLSRTADLSGLGSLDKGIYFVQVINGTESQTRRLVIQ